MSSDPSSDIKEFIFKKYPHIGLSDDDDVFALGFINSLFAMELVMFIEKHFNIEISNEDLKIDNFRTVSAMAALVTRQGAAA